MIPARGDGALARVLTVDYGVGGGFTIPTIDFSTLKNYAQVDQTVTVQQRTISSVQFGAQNPSLGTTTKITTTASHYYEGAQTVVITGTTVVNGVSANIDGNYTIQAAESSAAGWGSATCTVGTVERTPVVGAANKQVLEELSNASNVTGSITFAPTRKLLQFGVNGGVWQFDREITLTLTS